MRRNKQTGVSKNRTHMRKGKWAKRQGAKAISNPAGSKLVKQFEKAGQRGPRGF